MTATIKIVRRNGDTYSVRVDADDYAELAEHTWYLHTAGYAFRNVSLGGGKKRPVLMHRQILGITTTSAYVDHINGDKLDNRRSNLRPASQSENLRNTGPHTDSLSGIKGVSWDKEAGKWLAKICVHGKRLSLGRYETSAEAHAAYCTAAAKLHGEFARTS